MKSSTPIFKLISIAVLFGVVVYFSVQLYNYLSDPITTSLVYEAAAEDTIVMNGYLVREEETFSASAGTLNHVLSEGEKVGVGQTVVVAYQSAAALDTVERIDALELQLDQLEFALSSYLDTDAALKLDSTITDDLLHLHRCIADGDYSVAGDTLSGLKSAVMKRDYSYTTKEDIEDRIKTVEQDITSLRSSLSGSTNITASSAGVYSATCDGYETVLTPQMLPDLTVAQLETVKPIDATAANVGKLIYGDRWYYAAVLTESEAEQLQKKNTIPMRLAKGMSMDITMTIDRITKPDRGKCVLVMHSDRYLSQTTLLRHQTAELVLKNYNGLRMPSNALRVDENGVAGVYCVVGARARFKPIDVIYQGSGFVLVQPSKSANDTTLLRVGDEVIATTGELFDGKVIS